MRDEINKASKRAYVAARTSNKPITWQQARRLGVLWCAKMWPKKFEENPLIEWRGSRQFLKAVSQ
jgi:hypothetical protein